ncbi:MAG: 4Fe-4S binding protein [Syntrophobacteraceae bacterium]|nr:4Fe-4S binding protein [Syntrophobacteraceae bacterium]
MKELVVISGKGGTGKTSIVGAFAALTAGKVLCDADVDAANLHLLMRPRIRERHDFRSGHKAVIDEQRCIQCGDCLERCRFDAISASFSVDPLSCEGCGVCVHFCPTGAIDFPESLCGEWYSSNSRFGPLIHARLGIAEENSGKLVTLVRKQARSLAENLSVDLILTDGPPGTGCPVIASIGGASAVLIVSEPTVSGVHDLERVGNLAECFGVPVMVCVNKADLYWDAVKEIERLCQARGYPIVGRIPFDPAFTRSQVEGMTIIEYGDVPGKAALEELWEKVRLQLDRINQ